MKKIFSLLVSLTVLVSILSIFSPHIHADCEYNGWDIGYELDGCLWDSTLVNPWDGLIEWGVKNKVVYWTNQLSMLLGLLAVWAIVYGALMMTISVWEDEKIKKWKDIVKWSMLGFLGLLLASWIVRIVIEVMFSIGW